MDYAYDIDEVHVCATAPYLLTFNYPPKGREEWEFTVYFKFLDTDSIGFETIGQHIGFLQPSVRVVTNYIPTAVNSVVLKGGDINTVVSAGHPGEGGYNRTGFKCAVPLLIPTKHPGYYSLRLDVFLTIRPMEDPTTTDFNINIEPNFIQLAQSVELKRVEVLKPNKDRKLKTSWLFSGQLHLLHQNPVTVVNITWKDKTGVPPSGATVKLSTSEWYIDQLLKLTPTRLESVTEDAEVVVGSDLWGDEQLSLGSPSSSWSMATDLTE